MIRQTPQALEKKGLAECFYGLMKLIGEGKIKERSLFPL